MTDDLSRYLEQQLQDPEFADAYADEQVLLDLVGALTSRRCELGLSQRAVARLMGTTQSAVSDLERAEADPRISTLQRYARALGLQLLFDAKPRAAAEPEIRLDVSARITPDPAWAAAGGDPLAAVTIEAPSEPPSACAGATLALAA